jgi:hypothetical protein
MYKLMYVIYQWMLNHGKIGEFEIKIKYRNDVGITEQRYKALVTHAPCDNTLYNL